MAPCYLHRNTEVLPPVVGEADGQKDGKHEEDANGHQAQHIRPESHQKWCPPPKKAVFLSE